MPGGKLVTCKDGRIGCVYNNEPPINGKVRIHLLGIHYVEQLDDYEGIMEILDAQTDELPRLCDPTTLIIFGYFK